MSHALMRKRSGVLSEQETVPIREQGNVLFGNETIGKKIH